ncbi:substrate-binding domain-containing protein [Arthrobacter sp. 35W]|uniref:substrate-binding domain-containing protein n=1 Tax=Arthrobacter sp. 35W TaxID=1132441 RepID=UPI00054FBE36|nr:substrate-binding domain-containing protein [Arthrobacter sp. 35W]
MSRSVAQRRQAIVDLIASEGAQRVQDLATRFNISAVTLRRDIEELALAGAVLRTHGSVAPIPAGRPAPAHHRFTVGLVVPHSNYYYDGIIAGAKAAAQAAGVRLVLGVSAYDRETEFQQGARLVANGVDGLVIAPTPDPATGDLDAAQQQWLGSLPVPVVLVERPVAPGGPAAILDAVGSSHMIGAAAAIRHLADLGHTKLACLMISGPNSAQIAAGYAAAVDSLGLSSLGIIAEGAPGSNDAAGEMLRLLDDGATALFIHNDQLAIRAMAWIQDSGRSIPGDVSIVGYDDVIASFAPVPLTTVSPWRSTVGERSVQLLLERLRRPAGGTDAGTDDGAAAAEHVLLVPRLIVRESSAPPRQ